MTSQMEETQMAEHENWCQYIEDRLANLESQTSGLNDRNGWGNSSHILDRIIDLETRLEQVAEQELDDSHATSCLREEIQALKASTDRISRY